MSLRRLVGALQAGFGVQRTYRSLLGAKVGDPGPPGTLPVSRAKEGQPASTSLWQLWTPKTSACMGDWASLGAAPQHAGPLRPACGQLDFPGAAL